MTGSRSSGVALLLSVAGILLAVLLVREHLTAWEGGVAGGFFCGGGGKFDCNAVARSEASWWLGVPVALWGLFFYAAAAGLALLAAVLPARQAAAASGFGLLLALTALVVDGWLAWVMVTRIGAVCLQCVASYAINLALVVCFALHHFRSAEEPAWRDLLFAWRSGLGLPAAAARSKRIVAAATAIVIAGFAVLSLRPVMELRGMAAEEAAAMLERLEGAPEVDMERFTGQPTRGSSAAPVTIVVSSDFECGYCRSLAATIERLEREEPGSIRTRFVNSPVSSACNPAIKEDIHENACWLAEVAECAELQGRFWEYHDEIYLRLGPSQVWPDLVWSRLPALGIDTTRARACLVSGEAARRLAQDIALSREFNLYNTPSIVIDGHPQRGGVYPASLRAVVRARVAQAGGGSR